MKFDSWWQILGFVVFLVVSYAVGEAVNSRYGTTTRFFKLNLMVGMGILLLLALPFIGAYVLIFNPSALDKAVIPTSTPVPMATPTINYKWPTMQPVKQVVAETLDDPNCKHFTRITEADLYTIICIYGVVERDYVKDFDEFALAKDGKRIYITSNVGTFRSSLDKGTCVVVTGKPQIYNGNMFMRPENEWGRFTYYPDGHIAECDQ